MSPEQNVVISKRSEKSLRNTILKVWVIKLAAPPTNQEQRTASVRAVFADPERKREIMAKVHTEESDLKRAESMRKLFRKNPHLLKQLNKQLASARISTMERNKLKKLEEEKKYKEALAQMVKEGLKISEIAARLNISEENAMRMRSEFGFPGRIEIEYRARIYTNSVLVTEAFASGSIDSLSQRQKDVLRLHYLDGFTSFAKIGNQLGITREGARFVHNSAINAIKSRLRS